MTADREARARIGWAVKKALHEWDDSDGRSLMDVIADASLAFAADTHRAALAEGRALGMEEAAGIADKWCAENKAAEELQRKHGSSSMADRLAGSAIECNAFAKFIRQQIASTASGGETA